MHAKIERFVGLTDRQRAWVQREAAALGIPVPKVDALSPGKGEPSAWDPGSAKTLRGRVTRAVKSLDEPRGSSSRTRRRK